jgi:predicted ester cyclase
MSAERNQQICRRFFEEVLNQAHFEVIDEVVAPEVVSHSPWPGQRPGAEGLKDTMKLFRRVFPDLAIETVHLLAAQDKVMGYFRVSGTHQGEMMGIAPTGAKVSYEEAIVLRLQDGRIVEHWAVADALTLMRQIGAIPG